ncbi:hypothetical protein AB0P02_31120 [Streptomyces griseoluteus]|uniref:hypothetical protein n=1 Tax=Streptomyces griseoluteus TaxID=29306 RepID=UPI00343293D2
MSRQQVVGELVVDLEGQRARYDCLRSGCPHPREGPAYSTDQIPDPGNGDRRIRRGVAGLASWISGVSDRHLAHHHGSTT